MTPEQQQHLRKAFKVAGPKVRRLLKPLLPPAAVAFDNVELLVNPQDNHTELQIWLHGEPPESQSLKALRDRVAGKKALVIDIGANCGAFTVPLAAAVGTGSRVISFEPNPIMMGRLGENIRRNALGHVVRVEGCALGPDEGEAVLMLKAGNYGQASLKGVKPGQEAGDIRVPVRRLAPFLTGADGYDICVLKIDVEGFEDAVLEPWLDGSDGSDMPAAILIETAHAKDWSGDVLGKIEKAGYQPGFVGEGNTLFLKS